MDYEAAGVDPAPGNLGAKRRAVASGRWLRSVDSMRWEGFGALVRSALSYRPEDRPTARELTEEFRVLAEKEAGG